MGPLSGFEPKTPRYRESSALTTKVLLHKARGSFHYHHQRKKTYCKLERQFYFFFQVARGRKLSMSFGYINIMRKCQDRLQALGPTAAAAQQHMLRIYHQTQEWRGDNALDPLKWRWQLAKGGIMPIEMTKQAASQGLLKIVKCGCKTDCTRKNCIYKLYGIVCNSIFSGCRGLSCMNCEPINDIDP